MGERVAGFLVRLTWLEALKRVTFWATMPPCTHSVLCSAPCFLSALSCCYRVDVGRRRGQSHRLGVGIALAIRRKQNRHPESFLSKGQRTARTGR